MNEILSYKRLTIPEFFVSGIAVKTTNQNGKARKDIGDLWTKFMSESIGEKIAGKLSDDIYCVYTDYESDYMGEYTAVLGYKVDDTFDLNNGFFTALIPAGHYQVYTPQGKFPDSVGNAWMQIWETEIPRKYTADYDCCKAGAKSFEETEVEIYLSVV